MIISANWQRSSFSGSGDGNNCVEIAMIANPNTRIAIRDSKAPTRATLSFPAHTFTMFIETLKADISHTAV